MYFSKTPLRISFVGGGSDLESFYSQSQGSVISTAIDKYIYLTMHKLFQKNDLFLKYSKSEYVKTVNEIDHKIIKEVFTRYKIKGVDFNSSADIPSGTGLGSSSAFTAGLLKLTFNYLGIKKSNAEIAEEACDIEINSLKEPIGKQDQYACALGGLNQIYFNKDGSVDIEPILISPTRMHFFNDNLFLFFTGITRSASSILVKQKEAINDSDKFETMKKIVSLTSEFRNILEFGNIDDIGPLLDKSWNLKKRMTSQITNHHIDNLYEYGIKYGATGGKLLGAGGGGFVLFYCPLKFQNNFLFNMNKKYKLVTFNFDSNGTFSQNL
jgi:D-glycero-alpha-D-manno-heptose-7-phosphate kinase